MENLDTLELTIKLTPKDPWSDILVAELSDLGFDSFVKTEEGVQAYAAADTDAKTVMSSVSCSSSDSVKCEWEEKIIPHQNWNAEWEADFHPVYVDEIATILAPFHDQSLGKGSVVVIQPQMSFGTGHHPTTWQMMNAVHGLNPVNQTVLDMGCGTGALAIAASKLGARRVIAIDNDEWSYQNTIENIQRNDLVGKIEVIHGDAASLSDLQCTFDTILANINRNILLRDMVEYTKFLADKGTLVLSGFFPVDIPLLEKEAHANGLERTESFEREGWSCLMLVNNAS